MPDVRHKPVPPVPGSLDRVAEVRDAVPLVPGSVDDCCARLVSRAAVPAQDDARTWLTFLSALGLAEETTRGFVRTRDPADPGPAYLRDRFLSGVFGARELVGAVESADGPLDPDAAFERFRDEVPAWERRRNDDWEREWRERVRRILGWAALLGLVERRDGGYAATTGSS